jgi:futalosine hydrolase
LSKRYLISCATAEELSTSIEQNKLPCALFITGVGMVATAAKLSQHLALHRYDLVIHVGIAGAIDKSIDLGTIVKVNNAILPELGADDDGNFLNISDLKLSNYAQNSYRNLTQIFDTIESKSVWCVNKVHGNEANIEATLQAFDAEIETMESGGVAHVCQLYNQPFIEVRAISNYVTKRDKSKWDMGLAINNLNAFVMHEITKLINE